MIKSKVALISSVIILGLCMVLFLTFPNNVMFDARTTFMLFPISDNDGYNLLGIIGAILFIVAMILLAIGLEKYRVRTIIVVVILYSILPTVLITIYQETFASGIEAISYDGEGNCDFNYVSKDLLDAECNLVLQNKSNEAVTFELEFLDTFYREDEGRMASLMNIAGPYSITIEANQEKNINLKKSLDVSDVPKHFEGATSYGIHIKLIEEETERIL
ncbi:hypothetical protein [Paraliobacillus sediminis]|uniref:hypothetical protein n=1 Tax=Paraliobacillus sediminis TaxID=1885916 RepID=UPI000E3EABCD|nr:hypothetical protein [Paraliobacillus sediminis]